MAYIDDVHRAAIVELYGRIALKTDVVAIWCVCIPDRFQSELHSFFNHQNKHYSLHTNSCTAILQNTWACLLSFSFRVRFYFMRSCYITMRECMCGSKGFIETSWSILPPESKIRTHQPSYTIFTREGKPMANNAISNNISNNNNKPSTYWSNMPIIYIAMCECKRSKVALQQVTWHSYIAA